MLLLTNYQKLELIFGFILFLPLFYFYYKIQNIQVSLFNIFFTGICLIIILLIKNIIINYYEMNELLKT